MSSPADSSAAIHVRMSFGRAVDGIGLSNKLGPHRTGCY